MTRRMYRTVNALDKDFKPLILTWLANQFGFENYPHSFKDQYISWSIMHGELSVSFDHRVPEQMRLLSIIPIRLLGTPQYTTLKIVNTNIFYLNLNRLFQLECPTIKSFKLISKTKNKDNDGDTFYTYDWEVFLSDNTSIAYHNQSEKMDITSRRLYDTVQEREFIKWLNPSPTNKQQ